MVTKQPNNVENDRPALLFSEDEMVNGGEGVVETHIEQKVFPQQFIDAAAPSTPTSLRFQLAETNIQNTGRSSPQPVGAIVSATVCVYTRRVS